MVEKDLFTSESVTKGHPDKVADCISDGVVDALLAQDPYSRIACETGVKTNWAVLFGEITTNARVDYEKVAREVIAGIGYNTPGIGFDADSVKINTRHLEGQSPDIAMGVDTGGAGDQGMMFGYASNETENFMPAPHFYAQQLTRRLSDVREDGTIDYLRPDGKSQVTVEFKDGKPERIHTVLISAHHAPGIDQERIAADIRREVIEAVCGKLMDAKTRILVNPTGRFEVGGPQGDSGLTGRKIIVDTYGGKGRHGGGAFSGKDPTKVDRSAAYMGRHVAKNVVAAGLADKAEIQIAYAIGVADPISVKVETFGTNHEHEDNIAAAVRKVFDLRPRAIIDELQLRKPQYLQLAMGGHMGRTDLDVRWEDTNRTEDLLRAIRG